MKIVPYIGILVLLLIVLLQNKGDRKDNTILKTKIDTLVVYDTIIEKIQGKPVYLSTKIDTSIWMKKEENTPDSTYKGLLYQYKTLGNRHFSTNVFNTDFKIADYGTVTITDSVRTNKLISSVISTNLTIPTTTITIEKTITPPSKRQLYIGTTFLGNPSTPLSSVHGGIILKDKKDHLYGASVGYNGEVIYGGSLYFPLIKRNK